MKNTQKKQKAQQSIKEVEKAVTNAVSNDLLVRVAAFFGPTNDPKTNKG